MLLEAGPSSQHRIADIVYVKNKNKRTKTTGVVDVLEKAGLATRRKNPENRRENLIEITDTGRMKLARAQRLLRGRENDVARALRLTEHYKLLALLRKISSAARIAGGVPVAIEDGFVPWLGEEERAQKESSE